MEWRSDITGDLAAQVEAELDEDETDEEDGPDFNFDADEKTSSDPSYVFCPAEFRKGALRLVTAAFCQHPLLPEPDGVRTAAQIYESAVREMYMYCYQRNLAEVWAYMWTQWYQPSRWALWARSTSPLISRLRTTMNVENFWRQLKHDFLHHHLRPRLDELVYILIENVTPAYLERSEILEPGYRLSRARPPSTWQKYFKSSWTHLSGIQSSTRKYATDVESWTCNCGSQKFNAHLLCKHLVQAVGTPPPHFWTQVHRRRVTPVYRHSALRRPTDATLPAAIADLSGAHSITDGEDLEEASSVDRYARRKEEDTLLAKVRLLPVVLDCLCRSHTYFSHPCSLEFGSLIVLRPILPCATFLDHQIRH